jgi:hypothetical protein
LLEPIQVCSSKFNIKINELFLSLITDYSMDAQIRRLVVAGAEQNGLLYFLFFSS